MQNVLIDTLGTSVLWAKAGDAPLVENNTLPAWSEDRYIIGWSPWIGYGKMGELESHYMLFHGPNSLFVRGPHKESPSVMYDEASNCDFFPAGFGVLVRKGDAVWTQFLLSCTQVGTVVGGQANCRIFSVKA